MSKSKKLLVNWIKSQPELDYLKNWLVKQKLSITKKLMSHLKE